MLGMRQRLVCFAYARITELPCACLQCSGQKRDLGGHGIGHDQRSVNIPGTRYEVQPMQDIFADHRVGRM